ncbi:MAG: hypothetical protein ACRDQ5_18405, partial [Sciscionella sp.]
TRCPSVFAVVPADRRKLLGSAYELRLYCEEPGAWHRLPDGRGCYPITESAEWLRRFRPYLEYLVSVLKHAAPLVGPVLGMGMDTVNAHLAADCAAMKEVIAQIPTQARYQDEVGGIPADLHPVAHAGTDADFRMLEAMLARLDPERGWGGLSRMTTPEGLTLHLCAEHLAHYRAPSRF